MFGLFKSFNKTTDSTQVQTAIQEGAILVDVRSPMEFATGTAKGAINISLERLANAGNQLKNHKSIVVFCRSGNRSSQAKQQLNRMGFDNVLDGGTWQQVNSLIKE